MSERKRLKKGLNYMRRGGAGVQDKTLRLELDKLRKKFSKRWMDQDNIVGVAVAPRQKNQETRQELAIKIFVKKKLTPKELSKSKSPPKIPRQVKLPGFEDPLPLDVEEIGEIEGLSNQSEKAQGRSVIKHPRGGFGKMGCLVKKNGQDIPYILSNAHVLAPINSDPDDGDDIYWVENGQQKKIGYLEKWVKLENKSKIYNKDAAIAIALKSKVSKEVFPLGPPVGFSSSTREGSVVSMIDANNPYVSKPIKYRMEEIRVKFSGPNGERLFRYFKDILVCDRISEAGDSGSVVFNKKREVVGLVFAGSPTKTFICKINPIARYFGIQLY